MTDLMGTLARGLRLATAALAAVSALMGTAMAETVSLEVKTARASIDDAAGHPALLVELSPSGAKILGDFTARNAGTVVEVALGEKVLTSPYIRGPIMGGSLLISGNFTTEEVEAMVARIEAEGGVLILRLPNP